MLLWATFILGLYFLAVNGQTVTVPCWFAPKQCTCYIDSPGIIYVECHNVSTIPVFGSHLRDVPSLSISGNFTIIQNRTFYNLSIFKTLSLTRTGDPNLPLEIEPEAFLTSNGKTIGAIEFSNYATLTSIPTNQLAKAAGLTGLLFRYCNITVLNNQAFDGLIGITSLGIEFSQLQTIEPGAFGGLENYLNRLSLHGNELTVVPQDISLLRRLLILDLGKNRIAQVTGVEFPSTVSIVVLAQNPSLSEIDEQTFASVTAVSALDLSQCNFSSVPMNVLQAQAFSQMDSLSLQNNRIQDLKANVFGQTLIEIYQLPNLNYNPISHIDSQAFIGLPSVTTALFTGLYELTTVDFDIFSNMSNLYQILFKQCPLLRNVTVSDENQLSQSLRLVSLVSLNTLEYIDPKLGVWLSRSKGNTLDVSNNKRLKCTEDLTWMVEYLYCTFHPQIIVADSYCAETRVPLKDYLQHLNGIYDCS